MGVESYQVSPKAMLGFKRPRNAAHFLKGMSTTRFNYLFDPIATDRVEIRDENGKKVELTQELRDDLNKLRKIEPATFRIFVSYRRNDCDQTARLVQRLKEEYGDENVFFDVQDFSGLGSDFREQIKGEIANADVILAIIGERWAIKPDDQAKTDFVRIELELALESKNTIVPVLMGKKVGMPKENQLPKSLAKFPYLKAVVIDLGFDFYPDCERKLIPGLEEIRKSKS